MVKDIAILDIGSGKLVFAVGRKTANGITVIDNFAEKNYSGCYDGEWVDSDNLGQEIKEVIAKSGYNGKIKEIFVGTPSAFIQIATNSSLQNFDKERVVTSAILEEIYQKNDLFSNNAEYNVVNSCATSYYLNGNILSFAPIGERASILQTNMSYVLCKKKFCNMLDSVLSANNFSKVNYVSSLWAEGCRLLDRIIREKGAIVVDIGFVSCEFGFVKGEGLSYINTMPYGGGNITDELAYAMDVEYDDACKFLQKINLNQDLQAEAEYELTCNGEQIKFDANDVNSIVRKQLDKIVNFVEQERDKLSKSFPPTKYIYISGGGILYIRGALDYLQKKFGFPLSILTAENPQFKKPQYTTFLSVLDLASEVKSSQNIWSNLCKKLGGR
ncbi:MAG: hypothetical protein RSD04_01260 [Clostridia bacterium]